MWQVILGRLISGSGGAGMMALAYVIITGTVTDREGIYKHTQLTSL